MGFDHDEYLAWQNAEREWWVENAPEELRALDRALDMGWDGEGCLEDFFDSLLE